MGIKKSIILPLQGDVAWFQTHPTGYASQPQDFQIVFQQSESRQITFNIMNSLDRMILIRDATGILEIRNSDRILEIPYNPESDEKLNPEHTHVLIDMNYYENHFINKVFFP